jgi:outer membrane protein OmpA-like peptidoglycan-associated protein
MNTKTILVTLCVVMGISACSTPKTSRYNELLLLNDDEYLKLDQSKLALYIASASSQLLKLKFIKPERCISGQLAIAQSYLTRAITEHHNGMQKDAFITLVDFDRQIRKIRCLSQYINDHLGCEYSKKTVVLKRWYDEGSLNQCDVSNIGTKQINFLENENVSNNKSHTFITETLHEYNQDKIKPIYYPSLNKLAEVIKSYPESTLQIIGHADSKGSTEYNIQLSHKRASSVANYFTDQGINSSNITISAMGEKQLREDENNDVSRVFNRNTSIILSLIKSDN